MPPRFVCGRGERGVMPHESVTVMLWKEISQVTPGSCLGSAGTRVEHYDRFAFASYCTAVFWHSGFFAAFPPVHPPIALLY